MTLKDRDSFFSFFLEKRLYEVWSLTRIKEQIGDKKSLPAAKHVHQT